MFAAGLALPKSRVRRRPVGLLTLVLILGCNPLPEESGTEPAVVTIFAAASTTDALNRIAASFEAESAVQIRCSFAASSTLARQIEAGAPADLFLSADEVWMDRIERLHRLEPGTRQDLLGNTLVLIAPVGAKSDEGKFEVRFEPPFELAEAFDGRLALGDPAHVPAGRYAKQAFEQLGWWTALEERLLPAVDVRDALRIVALGEVETGIVYASDVRSSDRVRIVAPVPARLHSPIRYPVAILKEASPEARGFLEYLRGNEAARIFSEAGFTVLSKD